LILFEGAVDVHYGYFDVHRAASTGCPTDGQFSGQRNGLCGAAVPGVLHCVTGLHTGTVNLSLVRLSAKPSIDPAWEEVVEVSFATTTGRLAVYTFQDSHEFDLPAGTYRVRYSARDMDRARDQDTWSGSPIDAYLLEFWPGPVQPDEILRQTGKTAASWHRGITEDEDPGEPDDTSQFGGLLESLDGSLFRSLSAASDDLRRQVACWAGLRAAEQSGLAPIPALAPAITALRGGKPVPPPFDDLGRLSATVPAATPRTTAKRPPNADRDISQQDWAMAAMAQTAAADTLTAAADALAGAAGVYGMNYPSLFIAAREAFTELSGQLESDLRPDGLTP
jgi:hypothetical protein